MCKASEMIEGKRYNLYEGNSLYGVRIRRGDRIYQENGVSTGPVNGYLGSHWIFHLITEEPKTMNFSEALKLMRQGKKVQLKGWSKDLYLLEKHGKIHVNLTYTGTTSEWCTISEMLRNEWVELNEGVPLYTLKPGQKFKTTFGNILRVPEFKISSSITDSLPYGRTIVEVIENKTLQCWDKNDIVTPIE